LPALLQSSGTAENSGAAVSHSSIRFRIGNQRGLRNSDESGHETEKRTDYDARFHVRFTDQEKADRVASNGGGLLAFATLGGGSSYFCSDGPSYLRCPSVPNYRGAAVPVNYVTKCNLSSLGSWGGFGHYGFVFGEPFDLTTFFGASGTELRP
jgi:hypothetical protein